MLIGTAVCGKPHVRWCERAGEIKTSPPYSILTEDYSDFILGRASPPLGAPELSREYRG